MKVTFIGLGIMGSRMGANLLKHLGTLTVYNRTASAMKPLEALGALPASSAGEAVAEADVVFTMLATPEAVEETAFSEKGFLKVMKPGALWVDCSTVNPSFSRKQSNLAATADIRFMDIPVSGTSTHAENAQLIFLAGGDKTDLEALTPLLGSMGSRVLHAGEAGKGSSLKMLINTLLAQAMVAFSETLLLGQTLGFDKEFLLDTLPALPVCAPFITEKADMIRSDDFSVQFPLEWMHKDLHLVSQTAYEHKHPLFSATAAKEIYAAAAAAGLAREDFAAVYRFMKRLAMTSGQTEGIDPGFTF